MMKGIDVSVHNGTIDWQKVKDTGIDFAILRAGYGRFESQKDTKFEDNYAGAKAVGLSIGAYWYSYATTPDEAKQEAEVCISILNGKQFEYPIFFDLEENLRSTPARKTAPQWSRLFATYSKMRVTMQVST